MADDGLDISYGGAISVDSEALRDVGTRLRGVAGDLEDASDCIRRARSALAFDPRFGDGAELSPISGRIGEVRVRVEDAASGTALMANTYELVELRAQRDAMELGGIDVAALDIKIERLEASDSRLSDMADQLVASWEGDRHEGLREQGFWGGFFTNGVTAVFTQGLVWAAVNRHAGVVPPGATLQGTADPVKIRAMRTAPPTGPPANLADALRRVPSSKAQVRVEKYTMPDGSKQFVAYVTGTNPKAWDGKDPWDMRSNLELYGNERSSSYQATIDALVDSGAEPGDKVHAFGHSQGGMIVDRMAMESEFDVVTVVTAGSPIEPTLGEDVLSVQLRHSDDPISALAAGGSPGGTGSPGSIVAQRVADPVPTSLDLGLVAHQLDTYIKTAEMVDASGDARVESFDSLWEELATATEIKATDYVATRR